MNRDTYLKKIAEAQQLVDTLHKVCTVFEKERITSCDTYRAAINELHSTQAYIDRTRKKIGIK